MNKDQIIRVLKQNNERVTETRLEIINILIKSPKPLTVAEIVKILDNTNKTTVYRFLEKLMKYEIVKQLHLESDTAHFEIEEDHHHHVVCKNCQKINIVESEVLEEFIAKVEHTISLKSGYNDIEHSLEFFGFCGNCN